MTEQKQHNNNLASSKTLRVLMSGGGTGGHIFPAVAIAQEIAKRYPYAEFLFIGANGKMEMQKVPQAGFKIKGLDIAGFNRGNLLSNIKLPIKIFRSLRDAKRIIKDFRPDLAVGTGGFASGPALYAASRLGIPIFIQEQNAYAGVTNKILSKKAKAIYTAYPSVEGFHAEKIKFLGNPIRESIIAGLIDTKVAKEQVGLDPSKITVLSVGGSLGSRTLNNGWLANLDHLIENDIQLVWQTGNLEYDKLKNEDRIIEINKKGSDTVRLKEFISDMALYYSAADIIVPRAGAIAISELAVAKKPVLLVPFPFAAEDHQTKNALNLVNKDAALMVKDEEMGDKFWSTLMQLYTNESLRREMSKNLEFFAKPKAAEHIVEDIMKHIEKINKK